MSALAVILAAAAAAQATPAPPAAAALDRVMVCYLRNATLSDPADPQRFVPEGPHRLLAFRLPPPSTDVIQGASVRLHDPTNALLGRPIDHVLQQNGSFAFMTQGSRDDVLVLTVDAPRPGRLGGESYLLRAQEHRPIGYSLVGNCGVIPGDDPEGAFSFFQSQPGTRP